jgi:hypothetical protein
VSPIFTRFGVSSRNGKYRTLRDFQIKEYFMLSSRLQAATSRIKHTTSLESWNPEKLRAIQRKYGLTPEKVQEAVEIYRNNLLDSYNKPPSSKAVYKKFYNSTQNGSTESLNAAVSEAVRNAVSEAVSEAVRDVEAWSFFKAINKNDHLKALKALRNPAVKMTPTDKQQGVLPERLIEDILNNIALSKAVGGKALGDVRATILQGLENAQERRQGAELQSPKSKGHFWKRDKARRVQQQKTVGERVGLIETLIEGGMQTDHPIKRVLGAKLDALDAIEYFKTQ